jgi:hypothetical protein
MQLQPSLLQWLILTAVLHAAYKALTHLFSQSLHQPAGVLLPGKQLLCYQLKPKAVLLQCLLMLHWLVLLLLVALQQQLFHMQLMLPVLLLLTCPGLCVLMLCCQ